jgi:SNF2 family DNA or RNA helicase
MKQPENRSPIICDDGTDLRVISEFRMVKVLRGMKAGRWDPQQKTWVFPRTPLMAHRLKTTLEPYGATWPETIDELEQAYTESKNAKNADVLPDIPESKTSAWQHQRQAFHFAKDMPGAMLAMDMGTGKSKTAVGLICNRQHETNLIICPKSVMAVWPTEFKIHAQENFHITTLNKGTTLKKKQLAEIERKKSKALKKPFVLIINFDTYWREPLGRWLLEQQWNNIIYDESHRIKSHNGKASKFAEKLYPKGDYKICLTGTPMPHSPLDIFAQYRAISPDIFGRSYHRFKMHYAVMGGFQNKQITQFQNLEELTEKYEQISFRVGKEILDLPETIHSYRTFELSPNAQKIYNELDHDLYTSFGEEDFTVANAMVKVLRLQQLTGGYLPSDEGDLIHIDDNKLKTLIEVLEEIPQDEPTVIFARFTKDIEGIREACRKLKRTTSELSGKENSLKAWQDGETNTLAVQIRSGGVGINLTRACYNIYYSVGHSLGDYTQSLARSHRPGQTRTVRYYHLLGEKTVDIAVYKALQQKQEIINIIMQNKDADIYAL